MRLLALLGLLAACGSTKPAEDGGAPEIPVTVEGNREVPTRELLGAARRELRAFQERGGRAADAADAAWAMEAVLRDEGFAHGTVSFALADAGLRFAVDEGPRCFFGEVSFRGREHVPPEDLARYFVFPGSGALGTGEPYYRSSLVDSAAGEVERHYLLRGYYRVRVAPPETRFSEDRTRADVVLTIEEGPQYRVTEAEVRGMEGAATEVVGQPYHARLPVETAARLQRRLHDEGHAFAHVGGEAEIDHAAATVRLRFDVEPGPKVRLHEVRIEGEQRTRESFVRRRVPVEEGEILRQTEIDRAARSLYRTRLFNTVRLEKERVGEPEDALADLIVRIEERKARTVDFEAGWGSYEMLRGAVRYRDGNLFGLGRRLQTEIAGSLKSLGFDARVEDPYLLGESNTLELGGGYLLRDEPSYDLQSLKWDLTWRHEFEGPYTLRTGYAFSAQEARNVTGDIPEAEESGFIRAAGLFATLRRDTRDRPLEPAQGSLTEVGVRYSQPALGADLDFLAVAGAWALYRRITDRTVVAVGARFQSREILDDRETLPIQERLFLGGATSVRSFKESELGPSTVLGEPVGGLTAAEAFVEMRTRVWRDLHAGLFYDVGMVSPRPFTIEGPPGHGVGCGLRYMLPVGPIRLDVAYNPGRLFAANSRWAFHFAFGFSF